MEPLPQVIAKQPVRRAAGLIPAGLLLLVSAVGCESSKPMLLGNSQPTASKSHPVCQAVAVWDNKIVFTPDPVHNGVPSPGFAGRLYLLGEPVGAPLVGDGSIVVDLFDESHTDAEHAAVHLEQWHIDKDTLKRLLKADTFGQGYTIFLPWATCKPGVTRVTLKLRYDRAGQMPLFAASSPMALGNAMPATPSAAAARANTQEQLLKKTSG